MASQARFVSSFPHEAGLLINELPPSYVVLEDMFSMSHKIGLTKATFFAYIVPPFVCQYLMGMLVQFEGTRFYRLALLPLTVWLAWRATFVDMSGGDSAQIQTNSILIVRTHPSLCVLRSGLTA